ncbi:dual specificity protein phosphatase 1-A-like [Physella acuta]|uniref:dual specificity protein phosphatase 1-A-like n=1 Tax=Physella acuta TaxID=109671 RepID=UPI0027DC596F|nr:dual specificity protein phosphatase 1-A-like [Physella acuta]
MPAMENVCGLNVTEVTEVLASGNSDQILIIDCRSFLAFNQSRIVESVNIHCPPILKRRSGGFISLENIVPCEEKRAMLLKGVYPNVLVYDDNTLELAQASSDSNLLSVIKSLLKQVDSLSVRFIIGGFDAVREECPVLCMSQDLHLFHCMREKLSHKDRRRTPQQNEPAEILPHLYLGDVSHSSQRALLEQIGITALLNVSSNCGNLFQSQFKYMNIHINDNMDADLISWFPKIISFIDEVAQENGKVLVHCRMGVSRSATVCIAYIMQKQGLSLDSAFEFVMSRRPIIDPNLNFIQQLQRFETLLKKKTQPSLPTTSTTFSYHPYSGHTPTQPQSSNIFNFSTDNIQEQLCDHQEDMDFSSPLDYNLPPISKYQLQFPFPAPSPLPPLSPLPHSHNLNLSPSSISQTAASPSPVSSLGIPATRPGSLPLLHISSPLSSLPKMKEPQVGSSFISSPSHPVPYPISPLIDMFQEPTEAAEAFYGGCGNVPKTPLPNRTFSFFSSDIVTTQALSKPLDISPRQCRPTTPNAFDLNSVPYLVSDQSFPTVNVAHSPISPIGVPLSPLPSFG